MIGEKQQFKIKGMQQDTTESSFSGEFAFENMNMHIEAMESNTLLALTTQVGNTQVPIIVENTTSSLLALKGTPIGYSIVNNTLVIFTTDNTTDRIYKIYKTNEILYGKLLFEGSLNFNTVNPIECIPFYENENIQKVYWTDGRNQPRLINLTHTSFNKNSFDFVQDLSLKEKVTIVKNDVSEGMFPSGTVQYAFTYYNKYAQESNIFYVSPIYYSSFKERGGTGEEKVNNSFSIDVKNLDSNFEFLRIYSIVRTNIDSTPLVKKVIDVPIKNTVTEEIEDISLYKQNVKMYIFDRKNHASSQLKIKRFNELINDYDIINIDLESNDNIPLQTGDIIEICDVSIMDYPNTFQIDIPVNIGRAELKIYGALIDNTNFVTVDNNELSWKTINIDLKTIENRVICKDKLDGNAFSDYSNSGYHIGFNTSPNYPFRVIRAGSTINIVDKAMLKGFTFIAGDKLIIDGGNFNYANLDNGSGSTNVTDRVELEILPIASDPGIIITDQGGPQDFFINTSHITYFTFNIFQASSDYSTLLDSITKSLYKIDVIEDNIIMVIRDGVSNSIDISSLEFLWDFQAGDVIRIEGPLKIYNDVISKETISVDSYVNIDVTSGLMTIPFMVKNHSGNMQIDLSNYNNDLSVYNKSTSLASKFIDTNTVGATITPSDLLYIGGEDIIAQTITQKDNTLFLGDIEIKRPLISNLTLNNTNVIFERKNLYFEKSNSSFYGYIPETLKTRAYNQKVITNEYNSQKTFKNKETYRFGIQAQYKNGKWSDVLFINDTINNIVPETLFDTDGVYVNGSQAKYYLEAGLINQLVNLGYKRVRGVVVYPQLNDRSVIAQGVINPTLYNVNDRYNKEVDNISSWFFRPVMSGLIGNPSNPLANGNYTEFRHNRSIPGWFKANAEVQSLDGLPALPYLTGGVTSQSFASDYENNFYIDQSVLSFHSPEIEFDNNIKNIDGDNFSMRIIGLATFTGFKASMSLDTSNAPFEPSMGSILPDYGVRNYDLTNGIKTLLTSASWQDRFVKARNNDWWNGRTFKRFVIYPWHGSRSLNNQAAIEGRTAVLQYKKISNLRYAGYNKYFGSSWSPSNGITNVAIFDSNEETIVKINSPEEANSKIVYKGNVDKVLGVNKAIMNYNNGYPITVLENGAITFINAGMGVYNDHSHYNADDLPDTYIHGTEPVRIKFKSSPHAVFGLNWDNNGNQIITPCINNVNKITDSGRYSFWNPNKDFSVVQDSINIPTNENGLWIAELYRNTVDNRFGGTTKEAIENNIWLPCGEPVSLFTDSGANKTSLYIYFTEGDTFIQRYDCLKTYPSTLEDVNSISEVASFLVETHINLDGRTDRNRGNLDNKTAMPTNFNLMNEVYNQRNNFFTYHTLDYERFRLDRFPNTVTWTGSKLAGDIIDKWTNVTVANTLDLDGVHGNVRALRTFNSELISFQDTAISNILFNTRVQIPTSDNVPIELTNSYKVDGKRILSNGIGTVNKWSISESPYGLYFVDNITKAAYLFNGKLENLSDKLGFYSWFRSNCDEQNSWNPTNYNTFTSHYDKANKRVYFIKGDKAISFSELLQQFVSFHSYEGTPFMFNLYDKFYALRRPFTPSTGDTNFYMWEQNKGLYGEYFGSTRPYWTTIIANDKPHKDKIFNTVEFRADAFVNDKLVPKSPFDRMTVWNEYQNGSTSLTEAYTRPSTVKQRFRTWRANVPRDETSQFRDINYFRLIQQIGVNDNYPGLRMNQDGTFKYSDIQLNPNDRPISSHKIFGIDRMRNPWLFIKLYGNGDSNYKTVLHDIIVNYSV